MWQSSGYKHSMKCDLLLWSINLQSPDDLQSFDVIGAFGTESLEISHLLSLTFGSIPFPFISFWSSAVVHPAFRSTALRLMPSVKNYIHAVQQFLVLNNWRFVVLIVEQGDEGTEISDTFRAWAKLTRICVEVSITLDEMIDNQHIIHLLLSPTTPKVIVVFASKDNILGLVRSIEVNNATNRFVWIGNDALLKIFNTVNLQPGTFIVKYKVETVPEFQDHFKQLNLTNKNPWFRPAVKEFLSCDDHGCLENVLESYVISGSQIVPLIYGSVQTYANAVASLLDERCPNRRGQKALKCFKHHRDFFFGHLKTVSDGVTKKSKKFDDDGFVNGLLSIDQIVSSSNHMRPKFEEVATFDTMTKQLTKIKNFSVEYFKFDPAILAIDYKCQRPCAHGEYMAGTSKSTNQAECCWACKKCLDNERVSDNGKHCDECPLFHWPVHLKDGSVCLPLPTDYFSWYDPLPATLNLVSLVGVVFALCLTLIYWFNRHLVIIKASSIELSIVQLFSIIIGYVAVPVFLQKPSVFTCSIAHCFFSLSFNILYLGMLIKAVRVFRIFQTCRNKMRIKYTSPTFQLILTLLFVLLEVTLYFLLYTVSGIEVSKRQPNTRERYVELACFIPRFYIISFLSLDIFLLILCSFFAFKTMRLPSNFNESRYVSMCVVTTLIMWVAFMPAYFTTNKQNLKIVFLVLAIILNHSTAIMFLFVPRATVLLFFRNRQPSRARIFGSFEGTCERKTAVIKNR